MHIIVATCLSVYGMVFALSDSCLATSLVFLNDAAVCHFVVLYLVLSVLLVNLAYDYISKSNTKMFFKPSPSVNKFACCCFLNFSQSGTI